MNVAQLVMDSVERCGEYPAVYYEGQVLTNVEHLRRAERLATFCSPCTSPPAIGSRS